MKITNYSQFANCKRNLCREQVDRIINSAAKIKDPVEKARLVDKAKIIWGQIIEDAEHLEPKETFEEFLGTRNEFEKKMYQKIRGIE